MATPKTQKALRLMLYLPREISRGRGSCDNIQTFPFHFVTLNHEGQVRNPSDYDAHYPEYNNLEFYAQANLDTDTVRPYAMQLRYQTGCGLDLRDVERMYKMLKRAAKVEAAFPVVPATYGQFVQLMCVGLGVDGVVQEGKQSGTYSSNYDDNSHTTWKVSDIQWLVDRRIDDFFEALKPRPREVVAA